MNQLRRRSIPSLRLLRQRDGIDSGAFHQVSKFSLRSENPPFVFGVSAERSIFPWDRSSITVVPLALVY